LGQASHLLRHYGKSGSRRACARRFHRSIQWPGSWHEQISTVPDLTITLPEPVVIPTIDGRRRKVA
jgi:hypothetical protein